MTVIVFEGPDGSGKTGAINDVHKRFNLPMMNRASSSVDGPILNLSEWVDHFFDTWTNQSYTLLDRHPLISELIYGPICRGRLTGEFANPHWLRSRVQEFRQKCVVIWCLPPIERVQFNVSQGDKPQMSGVAANIDRIYWSYMAMQASLSIPRSITHDFTTTDNREHLYKYVDWVIHHI
jgi:hypothetical protein